MKHVIDFEQFQVNERKFNEEQREELAEKGSALKDGSYPISDKTDLVNAIKSQGRGLRNATENRSKEVLSHIHRRAKALGVKLEKTNKGYWSIKEE